MKKLIIGAVLIFSLTLSGCKFAHNGDNISITVNDNENDLNFTANYPEEKTGAVQNYIESYFKEKRIFISIMDVKKAEIKLTDGLHFYLNYEPGYISINFDRTKNSFTAYSRMKKMMTEFGNVVKD